MNLLSKLLIAGALSTSIAFFAKSEGIKTEQPNNIVHEAQQLKYSVDFMIVTPCFPDGSCYKFNDEILKETSNFYAEYDIDVNFVKQEIPIEGPISIDYDSNTHPMYGFDLKLALIEETEKDMPHILHAPMFAGDKTNGVLGVANQYLELIVLDQEMIWEYTENWEAHVLIHEIGHIFGLWDIYDDNSCNLMDGYIKKRTFICQRLTPEQVQVMYYSIENFLM